MQYSFFPSALAYVSDPETPQAAARALLEAVEEQLAQAPRGSTAPAARGRRVLGLLRPGHGHEYKHEMVPIWAGVLGTGTEPDIDRIVAAIDQLVTPPLTPTVTARRRRGPAR